MRKVLNPILLAAVLLAAVATGALARDKAGKTKEKSLYDRLGGKESIVAVVDDFVGRVAADTRINAYFSATAADPERLAAFKGMLVDQICEAAGGPCKYTGKDMKAAHAGMGISGADFDALPPNLRPFQTLIQRASPGTPAVSTT